MNPAERKAVAFFALLAAAGAGARALGIGDPAGARPPTAADRLALQHQLEAVDSAHARRERGRAGKGAGKGRKGGRRKPSGAAGDTNAIPSTSPAPSISSPREPSAREPLVVDVNAADTLALQALPGVGPALARRIAADRAAHGSYASIAELSRVRGIGAGLERRLAERVTFTPGGRPSAGSAGASRVPVRPWPAP